MCKANIFRTLLPDEIEVRVQQAIESKGKPHANLLLYKNARVDMDLLDEQFGCLGWQREHTFKNNRNYCKVSVYDKDHDRWVSKEDVGVESNTEEVKGEASDSFKRACVNLGIGRELYTAPSIFVELTDSEVSDNGVDKYGNKKYKCKSWVTFRVSHIEYDEKRSIKDIVIVDRYGNIRYTTKPTSQPQSKPTATTATTTTPQKQVLTMDALMNPIYSANIAKLIHEQWSKRKNASTTIADVIKYYYSCDEVTLSCLIKEINRLYA